MLEINKAMDIVSLCPLRTSAIAWQAHTGARALTVIVKATFVLEPGESTLAPMQEAVCLSDQIWDQDPQRSVRVPSDRAPLKMYPELMLVGRAYAPHGAPTRSFIARIIVGQVDKSIEVWCDRGSRLHDGQLLEGPRITEMPLDWEHAAGGPSTDNPVGMRFDAAPDRYGMVPIPNIQPQGVVVSVRSRTFAPVGFGPLSPSWPLRRRALGRHELRFRDSGWERWPLPEDFDASYFQAAPADQRLSVIRADEPIVLENLHKEHVRLVTKLPGIQPRAIADRATGEREELLLVADTLWIDTDRGLCCVVWRGRLGLRHAEEAGRIAVWVDGMPMALPVAEISQGAVLKAAKPVEDVADRTLIAPLAPQNGGTLPFVPGAPKPLEPQRDFPASMVQRTASMPDDGTGTVCAPMMVLAANSLPFFAKREDAAYPSEMTAKKPSAEPVPFTSALPVVDIAPLPVVAPLTVADGDSLREPLIACVEGETPRAERQDVEAAVPKRVKPLPAPPPMIGPLATEDMARKEEMRSPLEAKASSAEPVTGRQAALVEADAEETVAELSIEETAVIAAELAEGKAEKVKVLEAHSLSDSGWTKNAARWHAAMEEELGHGKNALRGAYDAAYVKRVEGFRGEIKVEEYARVVVGLERGRAADELDRLRIHREALMPMVRVWSRKVAQDMNVGKAAVRALREAREG